MLPGHQRFLNEVSTMIIDERKSVLVKAPVNSDLFGKLNEHLIDCSTHHEIEDISSSIKNSRHSQPIEFLWSRSDVSPPNSNINDLHLLFDCEELQSRIFMLHSSCQNTIAVWEKFLLEFAHVSKSLQHIDIPTFLLYSETEITSRVQDDLHIKSIEFQGYLSPVDIRVHLNQYLSLIEEGRTRLETDLYCSLISHIAAYDVKLVDYLIEMAVSLEVLVEAELLQECLAGYAESKNWESLSDKPSQKQHGALTVQGANKSYVYHSAYAAISDSPEMRSLINRRIWSALNETLMPVFNQIRCRMIEKYRDFNWLTERETVWGKSKYFNDIYENDIGDVCYRLMTSNCKPNDYRLMVTIKDMRDALAHFNTIQWHHVAKVLQSIDLYT